MLRVFMQLVLSPITSDTVDSLDKPSRCDNKPHHSRRRLRLTSETIYANKCWPLVTGRDCACDGVDSQSTSTLNPKVTEPLEITLPSPSIAHFPIPILSHL